MPISDLLHHEELRRLGSFGGKPNAGASTSASARDQVAIELSALPTAPSRCAPSGRIEHMYPPARSRAAMAWSYMASTMTTEFSDEHEVELSKIFEAQIFSRRIVEIGGLLDDDGDVAGADADRRRAARIGTADVVLRARDHDQIDRFHHAPASISFVTGSGRICTRSAGAADPVQLRAHDIRPTASVVLVAQRRGRNDHGVAALDRHHRLVDRRGARDWSRASRRRPPPLAWRYLTMPRAVVLARFHRPISRAADHAACRTSCAAS